MDYRFLLLGSLLPDLIDKPIGQFVFSDVISNGRIVSHTLLFSLLLLFGGLYLYRKRGKSWLLLLSFGTLAHIILDTMWLQPETLLWPFLGGTFPQKTVDWAGTLRELLTNPAVYVPELVGLAIVAWFAAIIVLNHKTRLLLRKGHV